MKRSISTTHLPPVDAPKADQWLCIFMQLEGSHLEPARSHPFCSRCHFVGRLARSVAGIRFRNAGWPRPQTVRASWGLLDGILIRVQANLAALREGSSTGACTWMLLADIVLRHIEADDHDRRYICQDPDFTRQSATPSMRFD